jgi:hypothetical protein
MNPRSLFFCQQRSYTYIYAEAAAHPYIDEKKLAPLDAEKSCIREKLSLQTKEAKSAFWFYGNKNVKLTTRNPLPFI